MSDFNYRGKLPFRIVSSSVDTGYNAQLTAAVGQNIQIVNLHQDEYSGQQDAPLQGPFTQEWVGGNQHRHIDLNTGSDNSNNRPEAFLISGSSGKVRIYGPTQLNINAPKATLTRDNIAKSSVNIKNIRNEVRRLGNFSKNYEVVQTVGRRTSNNLINDNFIASGSLTTQFINKIAVAVDDNFSSYANGNKLTSNQNFLGDGTSEVRTESSTSDKYFVLNTSSGVTRFLKFLPLIKEKAVISFKAIVNRNSTPYDAAGLNLEKADNNEDLVIQYSYDQVNWSTFKTILEGSNTVTASIDIIEENIIIDLPGSYYIRFSQTQHSGFPSDNYAITNVKIVVSGGDYALPDIANNSKSIFVERFNAPGGKEVSSRGALDREGEEYSPNNSLVTRNIKVRQPYYNQLTKHQEKYFLSSSIPLSLENGWNLSNTVTKDVLNISSNVTSPQGIFFKPDGTSFFTRNGDDISQYNIPLEQAWDLQYAKFIITRGSLQVGATDLFFDKTGTKMYSTATDSSGIIIQYYLNSAWNFTGVFGETYILSVTAQDTNPQSLYISDDGKKMFVLGSQNDKVYQYTLLVPWDLSTATYDNIFTYVGTEELSPRGIFFKQDGTRMYIVGVSSTEIQEYILNIPWDITSKVHNFSYSTGLTLPRGLYVRPNGIDFYIAAETAADSRIQKYSMFSVLEQTDHKVNRNSIQTIQEEYDVFVTASDYDNFWVQHAIPSTDLRYKWIADSAISSQEPIQYQTPHDSTELIFNSASLVISGTNRQFQVDNVGINSIIKNKKSINTTTNTFSITDPGVSSSYSEIANTPYGFSSWKEIRGAEHPVAKSLRNNNTLSVQTPERTISNNQIVSRRRSNSVTNFTEPPVTNKHKPLIQALKLKNRDKKYFFISSYNNNRTTVVNPELKTILYLKENNTQIGDMLGVQYRALDRSTNPSNPIDKLEQLVFTETLYPREVNAYLAETRGRLYFSTTSSTNDYTDRDNINIQLGTHRTYWKDSVADRLRDEDGSFYNSMNYKKIPTAQELDYTGSIPRINIPADPLLYDYEYRTKVEIYNNFTGRSIKPFDINENLKSEQIAAIMVTSSAPMYDDTVVIAIRVLDNGCSGELNYENFLDYFYSSSQSDGQTHQLIRVTNNATLLQFEPRTGEYVAENPSVPGGLGFGGTFETFGNLSINSGDQILYPFLPPPRPNYVAFLGGFESGSRNNKITEDGSDFYFHIENYKFFNVKPTGTILSTLDSGLIYDKESFGDKKPWFDSYEDYSDDIRSYAKDHSILPEFRVSSHMPYYVTEKGGNFRTKNSSFLEIDGVGTNYRSSTNEGFSEYNQDFINSYVTTDISTGDSIQKDNANLKLQNINFTVSGIKKLLPYNGFYPQERTIQLANLFNDFLDNNVAGGYFTVNQVDDFSSNINGELLINFKHGRDYFYKNAVLPYFFSPGILYNTIKSGISVSFPALFASNANFKPELGAYNPGGSGDYYPYSIARNRYLEKFNLNGSVLSTVGTVLTKFPFDSIIFPEKYIPINYKLSSSYYTSSIDNTLQTIADEFDRIISGSVLCNIKFDTVINPDVYNYNTVHSLGFKNSTGFAYLKNSTIIDPSYSMGMSNFLAEIPKFFLKNGSMNVFRSSEIKDWKTFEIGKKYYLDLRMKKSSDLVMIEAYRSQYHVTGTSRIEKTFNGRYFGWPVSKISGSDNPANTISMHNDPAYAPFTPPYFEGEAVLRMELSASKTTYTSVNDLEKDIKIIDIFQDLAAAAETGSVAYDQKMSIQDCMEIFGIGQNPIVSFGGPNNASNFEQAPDISKQYWAISTKLETPVLDFSEQQFKQHTGSYWISSGYGRGMWSGYGKIPTGSKGITIEIAESFPLQTGYTANAVNTLETGSLLRQVGFQAESAKIGQLAESKTISEGIVMIPYVDAAIAGKTVLIDNHNFFAINNDIFNTLNNDVERGVPSVIPNETVGYETSITKMIKRMKNYVIPPRFNFLKYDNIKPFVMYLFEFTHDLDQQDLADIWQGVMPKIGTTAEHDTVQFGHKTGQFELFGEDFKPPENMRWMVFKVKKKAEWNYFAITENIGDDQNFKFKFANSQEAKTPDYSYNWPYDYFSLVELAKVDVSYNYEEVSGSVPLQQQMVILR